jgi:hypothetical protein
MGVQWGMVHVLGSGLFRSSVAWFVLSVPAHVLLEKRWD